MRRPSQLVPSENRTGGMVGVVVFGVAVVVEKFLLIFCCCDCCC